jgi:hypothetical protein
MDRQLLAVPHLMLIFSVHFISTKDNQDTWLVSWVKFNSTQNIYTYAQHHTRDTDLAILSETEFQKGLNFPTVAAMNSTQSVITEKD